MGEAWGQPRANCLDVGVKTRWFVGTVCVRSWGRGGHVDVDMDACTVMAHSLSQPYSLSQSKENFCNLYFMA